MIERLREKLPDEAPRELTDLDDCAEASLRTQRSEQLLQIGAAALRTSRAPDGSPRSPEQESY